MGLATTWDEAHATQQPVLVDGMQDLLAAAFDAAPERLSPAGKRSPEEAQGAHANGRQRPPQSQQKAKGFPAMFT